MTNEIKICFACGLAIGEWELSLNHTYHMDCMKCLLCGNTITHDMMDLAQAGKATREHSTCRDKRLEAELLAKEVTVSQHHLDYLNRIRLLAWVEPERDIAGNSQSVEQQFRGLKIHEMDLDNLYKFLSKYQTMAALVSIVIAQKKDSQLKKASADYRDKTEYDKKQERQSKLVEETKKLQLQAERLDPKLRERRKAIEQIKKTFPTLTDEDINKMLESVKS